MQRDATDWDWPDRQWTDDSQRTDSCEHWQLRIAMGVSIAAPLILWVFLALTLPSEADAAPENYPNAVLVVTTLVAGQGALYFATMVWCLVRRRWSWAAAMGLWLIVAAPVMWVLASMVDCTYRHACL